MRGVVLKTQLNPIRALQALLPTPALLAAVPVTEPILMHSLVPAPLSPTLVLSTVARAAHPRLPARPVHTPVPLTVPSSNPRLRRAPPSRTLVRGAERGVDVDRMSTPGAMARMHLAVVRAAGAPLARAPLEVALVRGAERRPGLREAAAARAGGGAGDVLGAVGALGEARARAARGGGAGEVDGAVGGGRAHGADGRAGAARGAAEGAGVRGAEEGRVGQVRAVAAAAGGAGEVGLADGVLGEARAGAVEAAVVLAEVGEGRVFSEAGFFCAVRAAAFPVEGAVSVCWAAWVDAEGGGLVPGGQACVVLAVG